MFGSSNAYRSKQGSTATSSGSRGAVSGSQGGARGQGLSQWFFQGPVGGTAKVPGNNASGKDMNVWMPTST